MLVSLRCPGQSYPCVDRPNFSERCCLHACTMFSMANIASSAPVEARGTIELSACVGCCCCCWRRRLNRSSLSPLFPNQLADVGEQTTLRRNTTVTAARARDILRSLERDSNLFFVALGVVLAQAWGPFICFCTSPGKERPIFTDEDTLGQSHVAVYDLCLSVCLISSSLLLSP